MKAPRYGMLVTVVLLVAPAVAAQKPKKGAPAPTPVDTTPPPPTGRLSWTSDRRPIRVGDLLTIVVDEKSAANETQTNAAHLNRKQQGTLDTELAPEKLRSVGIGYDATSDAGGAAGRSNDLSSVLSVRVTALEPGGIARVSGSKLVTVDGRKQEVTLSGIIRAEDVAADNSIRSERVANAEITYKGKKIGPATGIFGKILASLWP
jgi:flagellar L-ring protein precursor FlgH